MRRPCISTMAATTVSMVPAFTSAFSSSSVSMPLAIFSSPLFCYRVNERHRQALRPFILSAFTGNEVIANFDHDGFEPPRRRMQVESVQHSILRPIGFIKSHIHFRKSLGHPVGNAGIPVKQDAKLNGTFLAFIQLRKTVNSHQAGGPPLTSSLVQHAGQ